MQGVSAAVASVCGLQHPQAIPYPSDNLNTYLHTAVDFFVQGVSAAAESVCKLQHTQAIPYPSHNLITYLHTAVDLLVQGVFAPVVLVCGLQHPSVHLVSQPQYKHITAYSSRRICAKCLCCCGSSLWITSLSSHSVHTAVDFLVQGVSAPVVLVSELQHPQVIPYPSHNLITYLHTAVDFLMQGFLPLWY